MSDDAQKLSRAEMLAAVVDYRERLKSSALNSDGVRLLAQLDAMEKQLIDGEVPAAEFEQFELHWSAHLADLQREIFCRSAHLMLAFEDMEREDPNHFANDDNAKQLLYWWRNEGGREEFMGSIPLEERKKLEEMARQWREKNK
jgi:hypothetical protein